MGLIQTFLTAFVIFTCVFRISTALECYSCTHCGNSSWVTETCSNDEECVRFELVPYSFKSQGISSVTMRCAPKNYCEKEVQRARIVYHNDTLAKALCELCREHLCNSSPSLHFSNPSLLFVIISFVMHKL